MSNSFIVVFVTCPSRREADSIAGRLLKKRLIACANIIGGVSSAFWWNGKIDSARETLIIMKSKRGNFKRIEKAVKGAHSYDVPEIIALPIAAGSEEYLKWIQENVSR